MKLKQLIGVLLLAVTAFFLWPKDDNSPVRILFIGNSYTYFNSSPELLKAMTKEQFPDKPVETKLVSRGGMTLEGHWNDGRALAAIEAGNWDYVVLQEQSKMAMPVLVDHETYFGNTDLFFEYARKFDAAIKKAAAETVFFMTWSVVDRPEEQKILTHAYTTIANELDAILVPVGLAWDLVRKNNQINLYVRDGSHPSEHGSYLVASTFFSTLFDKNPAGLSGNLSGFELASSGESALESSDLMAISASDAQLIQAASWTVSQSDYTTENYPDVQQPKQSYTIPKVQQGEPMQLKDIEGRWYGTSTYSNDYFGVVIDVTATPNQPEVKLSLYSADRHDDLPASNVRMENDQLLFAVTDALRGITTDLTFSLTEGELNGVSTSFDNNVTRYKHWNFSKKGIQNGSNLARIVALQNSFQANKKSQGYVKAALNYNKQYSKLIGAEYRPARQYLMVMSEIQTEQGNSTEAQGLLDLAAELYSEGNAAPPPPPASGTGAPPPPPGTGGR